jgi:hypothetical protein
MPVPDKLPPGLYDNLVDRRLRALLDALDTEHLADVEPFDSAEAPDRIGRRTRPCRGPGTTATLSA